MQFKLLSIDNEKENPMMGETDNFLYDGKAFVFGSIRSGGVKSIVRTPERMIVATKNSTYIFEAVS